MKHNIISNKNQTLKAAKAIKTINNYSLKGIPFLCIIDFDKAHFDIIPLDKTASKHIYFDIKGFTNYTYSSLNSKRHNFTFLKKPISKKRYQIGFENVQNALNQGNSFLVNLTYRTVIETDLSLKEIFEYSSAKYKLLYKDKFVVFSPETFVEIDENGIISSKPMKGTIDANLPDAEKQILNDPKEKAEHNTIVDLIRNDLSQVAQRVRVERFRYIDIVKTHEKHLLQVSSEIKGDLPSNWRAQLGDIILKLLPAGSISGAPKPKTVQIIKESEIGKRGFYTGIIGIFDGKNFDSGVLIRYIEQSKSGEKSFKSGGGITVFSNLDNEYQELIDKVYVPIIRDNPSSDSESQPAIIAIPH